MITGKRVRLRAIEMDDLDRFTAWMNDPEVTQYLSTADYYPTSRLAQEQWLQAASTRTRFDDLLLAIETLESARHIGSIALHSTSASNRRAELGIMIGDKDYGSRGYGTDAILTILRFAFDEMNLHRVYLTVLTHNARAIACYKKCGFIEEGRLREERYLHGAYTDRLLMAILDREYRALHTVS
jgi:RimJ/RimL family protein N-acetyltransferase